MDENLNGQNQPKTYGEESPIYESGQQPENGYNSQSNYNQPNYGQQDYNQQSNYGQQNYGQQQGNGYNNQSNYNQPNYGQQDYGQPNYGQPNYNQPNYDGYYGQPQHGPVTDIFCYILLVIMPLRRILMILLSNGAFSGMTYESIMDGSYAASVVNPGYMMMSTFSSLLSIAYLIFMILDIVMVRRQNYKMTGLILFAIFLNPGYYIWRAHVVGRNKTFPIIYTIIYSILTVGSWFYYFYSVFQTTLQMLQMMN